MRVVVHDGRQGCLEVGPRNKLVLRFPGTLVAAVCRRPDQRPNIWGRKHGERYGVVFDCPPALGDSLRVSASLKGRQYLPSEGQPLGDSSCNRGRSSVVYRVFHRSILMVSGGAARRCRPERDRGITKTQGPTASQRWVKWRGSYFSHMPFINVLSTLLGKNWWSKGGSNP